MDVKKYSRIINIAKKYVMQNINNEDLYAYFHKHNVKVNMQMVEDFKKDIIK